MPGFDIEPYTVTERTSWDGRANRGWATGATICGRSKDLIWTYLFSRTVRDICSEQKNGGPWGNEPPG